VERTAARTPGPVIGSNPDQPGSERKKMSNELKCNCQYCNGHIPFPAEMAGQSINCPHCQLETLLFIPPAAVELKQPPPTRKNPNAVGLLVIVVVLTACFVGVFFLTSSQKQTRQAKPANLKPVVGAFGWKLGDKLPEQLKSEVHDGRYNFRPEKEMPPFDDCVLMMTDDGRIYCIEATASSPDYVQDSDSLKNALISLLSEKYGLRHHDPNYLGADQYVFGSEDRSASLEVFERKLFTLKYYDTQLQNVAYEQQEARRKKDEDEKKAALSKGL
jgi:hypothetical protein